MVSTGNSAVPRPLLHRRLAWAVVVASVVSMVGCGDKYEPRKEIDGVFHPRGCVQLEGRRDGWLRLSTIHITVCQPIRVSELGVMTYGWEVRQPGWEAEVGRLEFSDAAVYIVTERLNQYGQFEYSERSPTVDDWMRHNPAETALLALVALGIVVTILVLLVARSRREQERLERERLEREQLERKRLERERERVRLRAEAVAARAVALAKLKQLIAEAQGAAGSLPIILGEAEIALDRAQDELRSGLYSPFWEAVEVATAKLDVFHQMLS